MLDIKTVAAGQAIVWYKCGWKIFAANMLNWVLIALVFGVSMLLLGIIPFFGVVAVYLVLPLLQAGMVYAAHKTSRGEPIDLKDLFVVFQMKDKRGSFLALGALMLVTMLIVGVLSIPLVGGIMMSSLDDLPLSGAPVLPTFGAGGFVFVFLVGILLAMLFFYAPALILLRDLPVIEAIKTSFSAALKNLLPFILFVIIYAVLSVVAAIPFGLGFLVLLPVAMAASYCSYKDIFS